MSSPYGITQATSGPGPAGAGGIGASPPAGAPEPASAFALSSDPKPLTSSNESFNSIV